jgi:hypothetical protein
MTPAQRTLLTKALSAHVAAIAADLRAQMLAEGVVRERARRLHADEHVGDDFEVWTDLLSRRAAVLWVLKTVYVRVLEDRGLLRPGRLLDPEAQQLFEKLAPNLGETAFLSWVFRDLASPRGGLPELFAPQPAEVAVPTDALSRALIGYWRAKNADTGFQWSFAGEAFAGELMGDLYQELDPVVKDRYALCQTPDFVRDFMLGQTLEPAIKELGADQVRLLDPACGSGHFLLDALRRLVDATAAQHKDWSRRQVVDHVIDRVVGIDLNDYACALARARLIMTAAELAGVQSLADAAQFHPHVYWADALEQIERDEERQPVQLDLLSPGKEPPPRAVLTRPHVRAVLRPILKKKFQVVVGNPPYIAERDPSRKDYHRETVGAGKKKARRYVSAYREYSLAAPFVERCLQLSDSGGRIGLIVGNNFMKREFGKPLIEEVLARIDLQLVVDSSQAFIPHHGTPTVILFAQNRAPEGEMVLAVMGKRGEPRIPDEPASGKVWRSIVEGVGAPGFENEFVSVARRSREVLACHPWSLGGGGASELRKLLEERCKRIQEVVVDIGFGAVTREDDVYVVGEGVAARWRIPGECLRPMVTGASIRDWAARGTTAALWPYDATTLSVVTGSTADSIARALGPWRTGLRARVAYGESHESRGLRWFEYSMFFVERFRGRFRIAYAHTATANHFFLDRGGRVIKDTAPILLLGLDANEDEHLALLGILNCSTACFWMKQVFQPKAAGGMAGRGLEPEPWMERFAFDATKMKLFPVPANHETVLPWARELDRLARRRAERPIGEVLAKDSWLNAAELRALLYTRREADFADLQRMVALQEELDWECYALYGIDEKAKGREPEQVVGLPASWRPVELRLAARDRETRAAIERGDETTEIPTLWFERHRWEPLVELPSTASASLRELTATRQARIEAVPELGLIEQSTYKRRWYRPDYDAEEQQALSLWLADRIEREFSGRGAKGNSIVHLTTALEGDPRVHAVAELISGRKDYRLADLVEELLHADAVPEHPFHIYKPAGLEKRAAWERTWDEQRKEDAGQPAKPEVPPKYGQVDFLKPEYFRLRGKLDVPKERFIVLTEVPGRGAGETLYGWAGWTPAERVKALLALDEECEDQGISLADRIALLDSAWRLIPDVTRDDSAMGSRLKAELQALVGLDGPSKVLLDDWKKRFPPPSKGRGRGKKPKVVPVESDDEAED